MSIAAQFVDSSSRRRFLSRLAHGAFAPLFAGWRVRASEGSDAKEMVFQGPAPGTKLSELDEKRLLVSVGGEKPAGAVSMDAGKSWGDAFPYLQGGGPLEGSPQSILRLRNGRLGMIYARQELVETASYTTPAKTWMFAVSEDDGRSWSAGTPLDLPQRARWGDPKHPEIANLGINHTAFGELVELAGGRLVLPLYWYAGGRFPELHPDLKLEEGPGRATIRGRRKHRIDGHLYEAAMGGCYTYFSDDQGKTWGRSVSNVMVWPLPGEGDVGGFGACWEPVLVERKDGAVAMFVRTNVGRIFQSISRDGGRLWSAPAPTELSSGDVPCAVGRLRTTGDLVVIWNQASAEEIRRGYSRGRLSVAVSGDDGRTWGRFRTLEVSEGLARVDRVQPSPIKHVRAAEELGRLPDGYAYYHYPSLAFVQGKVVFAYSTRRADAAGSFAEDRPTLRVVEEGWLYG